MSPEEARKILAEADLLCSAEASALAVRRVANEITARLAAANPLVLAVMGGAVVFTGQLLPLLAFPLDFDYLHVTRYGDVTTGGKLSWIVEPRVAVAGRTVLVVDDILDEGVTMAAIVEAPAPAGRARGTERGVRRKGPWPYQADCRRFRRRAFAEPLCFWLWHGRQGCLAQPAGGLCRSGYVIRIGETRSATIVVFSQI